MPSNQTTNYQLSQWVKSDQVKMEDFNADNAKIDEVLGEHAEKLAGCGNCRIEALSYTGVWVLGDNRTRWITFSARPMFVMVIGGGTVLWANGNTNSAFYFGPSQGKNSISMEGTAVSWSGHSLIVGGTDPYLRMDQNGETYYAVGLLDVTQ